MLKAIYYKEWIKCRNIILLLGAIALSLSIYIIISSNYAFRNSGVMTTWLSVADGGESIIPSYFCWFLVSIGGIIAAVQFSSEMVDKRLKLTLHLPRAESKIILSLSSFGLMATALISLMAVVTLAISLQFSYPYELVVGEISRLLPYFFGGFTLYNLTAMVVVEPIWRRKVTYIFIAVGALYPFVIGAKIGANMGILSTLILIVIVTIAALFFAVNRFKDGAQS